MLNPLGFSGEFKNATLTCVCLVAKIFVRNDRLTSACVQYIGGCSVHRNDTMIPVGLS